MAGGCQPSGSPEHPHRADNVSLSSTCGSTGPKGNAGEHNWAQPMVQRTRLENVSQAGIRSRMRRIMSKVFVNIALSLDGYMAPEGMTMEHWDMPEYRNWGAKWGALMRW